MSTRELIELAAATRQKLTDAAEDLTKLTAELRRRIVLARTERAAGRDVDDLSDVHVGHLHVEHLTISPEVDPYPHNHDGTEEGPA